MAGDEQAKQYRDRAEQVLAIAADLKNLKSKETLLAVAMDYLQMGLRVRRFRNQSAIELPPPIKSSSRADANNPRNPQTAGR